MSEVSCVLDAKALLGESTYWDPHRQVLWWIDIYGRTIHRFDPATAHDDIFVVPHYLGCLAVRRAGGLIVTMANGFHTFDPSTGRLDPIVDPEADLLDTRFNDGKTDRQGRFWSGSMFEAPGKPAQRIGSLWRLDADRSVHQVIDGIGCSNGLAWSPDGKTMYFTDSHTPTVWAFDFDPVTGDVENRRVFADVSALDGIVDGATVDEQGCYWATVPFKGKVLRYDPEGVLMRTVVLPVDLPTCCEFGGADLDLLYVTSATLRRTDKQLAGQPLAGGLFAIDAGVKGLPLVPYIG